jgi:hypothetical protein
MTLAMKPRRRWADRLGLAVIEPDQRPRPGMAPGHDADIHQVGGTGHLEHGERAFRGHHHGADAERRPQRMVKQPSAQPRPKPMPASRPRLMPTDSTIRLSGPGAMVISAEAARKASRTIRRDHRM